MTGLVPSQRLLLQCEVSIKIDLGGFYRLVSEPKRNHRTVNTGLQQFHGGGVAENMRRYSLLSQRSTTLPRLPHVSCKQVLHAVGA